MEVMKLKSKNSNHHPHWTQATAIHLAQECYQLIRSMTHSNFTDNFLNMTPCVEELQQLAKSRVEARAVTAKIKERTTTKEQGGTHCLRESERERESEKEKRERERERETGDSRLITVVPGSKLDTII